MIPALILHGRKNRNEIESLKALWRSKVQQYTQGGAKSTEEQRGFLQPEENETPSQSIEALDVMSPTHLEHQSSPIPLTLTETFRLALEFCMVWFLANYFTAACLEHTSVASSTILTSTSSVWTLIMGSLWGVERFSVRKLLGVLASLTGVILIATVDMSGESDKNRGTFPHKSAKEIAVGNTFALLSAVLYGLYTVLMKKKIGDETRINMPLFFGLVGLINVFLLWPGIIILHFAGVERFELPPTQRVLLIVVVRII